MVRGSRLQLQTASGGGTRPRWTCSDCGLSTIGHTEFLEDLTQPITNRLFRETEFEGDCTVIVTLSHEGEDIPFARGQEIGNRGGGITAAQQIEHTGGSTPCQGASPR